MSSTSKSKRKKSDLKRIKREAYRGDITSQVIKDNIEESNVGLSNICHTFLIQLMLRYLLCYY